MKIAIYEPEPRLCGPMMWAWEILHGLRRSGHEAVILTSTKSGKASSMWGSDKGQVQSRGVKNWPHKIDLVVKHSDLVATMDSFDLIIMPDIWNSGQDKAATKGWDAYPSLVQRFKQPSEYGSPDAPPNVPLYVHALQATKTKWITGLHGNLYSEKRLQYLHELMASDSRSKLMYTNSPYSLNSPHPVVGQNTWLPIHLPYRLRVEDDAPLPPLETIGTTGRFIFNKGQPTLALAASMIDPRITTELWGACSAGLGPSPTFVTFENMIKLDPTSQRKRYGNKQEDDETGMGGNIVASFPWDFRYSGGQLVRYLGVYPEPTAVTRRLGLHLGLTSGSFSGGLVEFASLEAMDGGSVPMALPNISHPDYAMAVLQPVETWTGLPKLIQNIESVRWLAERIDAYLSITDDQRLDIREHNRQTIRRLNDPSAIGEQIIEMAFAS